MSASEKHQPRRGAKAPKFTLSEKLPTLREIQTLSKLNLESLCSRLNVQLPPNPTVEELKARAGEALLKTKHESNSSESFGTSSSDSGSDTEDSPQTPGRTLKTHLRLTSARNPPKRLRLPSKRLSTKYEEYARTNPFPPKRPRPCSKKPTYSSEACFPDSDLRAASNRHN